MFRTRFRIRNRGGASMIPWYDNDAYKADGVSPTLLLDFVNQRYAMNGAPFNFAASFIPSRASTAMYVSSSGVLTDAATNVARYTYNPATLAPEGLYMEPAATNRARPSRDIAAWATNSGNTRTNNVVDSPYGALTGAQLVETAASTFHYTAPIVVSPGAGVEWVFSTLLKKKTDDIVQLADVNNTTIYANFNLTTGVVTAQGAGATFARMEDWGNGWWLCEMTSVAGSSTTPAVVLCNNNPSSVWIPNYLGVAGDGVYIADFQAETGRESTSRIVTTTASVTRAEDAGYLPTASFYTASAPFTMFAEYVAKSKTYASGSAVAQAILSLWDGSNTNRTGLRWLGSTPEPTYVHVSAGVLQLASGIGVTSLVRTVNRSAIALGGADSRAAGAGVISGALTLTAPVAGVNRLSFGVGAGSSPMSGVIRQVSFWNNLRVSNSELQRIAT